MPIEAQSRQTGSRELVSQAAPDAMNGKLLVAEGVTQYHPARSRRRMQPAETPPNSTGLITHPSIAHARLTARGEAHHPFPSGNKIKPLVLLCAEMQILDLNRLRKSRRAGWP